LCSPLVAAGFRGRAKYGCQCRSGMMSTEEVVPQLAANMNAAFKRVWKIIGATNPGDVDLVVTRIVELAKDGVYDTEELSRRTLSSLNSASRIVACEPPRAALSHRHGNLIDHRAIKSSQFVKVFGRTF
jgi:hypothetical protein